MESVKTPDECLSANFPRLLLEITIFETIISSAIQYFHIFSDHRAFYSS